MENDAVIRSMLEEVRGFYASLGRMFSQTRQGYWHGWLQLQRFLPSEPSLKVCDLGCGNGRFFGFLRDSLGLSLSYIGYDSTLEFLSEAKSKYSTAVFTEKDIFLDLATINEKFDLVVGFGITHHLPDAEFRRKWFAQLTNLLHKDSILVLTFWNFQKDKRFQKARKVDSNDYYLRFNNSEKERYFHEYTHEEIESLLQPYNIVTTYKDDGKTGDLNTYYVLSLKSI